MREPGEKRIGAGVLLELYGRLGAERYLYSAVLLTAGIELVTLMVAAVWSGRFMRLSFIQTWVAFGIAFVLGLGAVVAVLLRSGDFGTLRRWSRNRSVRPPELVWAAAVRLVWDVGPRATVICIPAGVVAVVIAALVEDLSLGVSLGLFGCGLVALLAGAALVIFCVSTMLRPLIEEVVADLGGRDGLPEVRVPSLAAKATLPLLPVTLFSVLMVGAWLDLVPSGPARVGLALGIGAGTVAIAGCVYWVFSRSTLLPLQDLLAAARRIGAGDLDTPVPVVSGDELGDLARAFNQMRVSLRDHDRALREAQARIVASADQARRRVERDLHDGAQQQLVLLGLKLSMLERDPSRTELIADARNDLGRALAELRDLAHGIYPSVLENEGLAGALREAAGRSGIRTEMNSVGNERYPARVEAAVYFCCVEALQNAAKHAGEGACVRVRLRQRDHALTFEVSDDGLGFESRQGAAGGGLQNIADRVGALGGEVLITSTPGIGTSIAGVIPLDARQC
jgi:signal transduction histidine kinase